ncbi:peroxisomal and mitochondrial division factor 2-like [Nymphaea colorata]|uniref:peroxisomal and mitochondrial division factor 2-like n=1 Tax=Nymphaea colorata TaxID=210225 RepID=UPI00129D564A|nr:peroxisomal and mitochondrial division factor 2-like [Nymphaea colorata]
MSAEELPNGGKKENRDEFGANSNGDVLSPPDQLVAQKDREIEELKKKLTSLEAQHLDLRTLVEEQTFKMMSAIESSEESERRAATTSFRLEATLEELGRANSTVGDLQQELRMLKSVASRATELETQVARLQHDLNIAMNERDEVSTGFQEMRSAFEAMKNTANAKDSVIRGLKYERDSLKEQKEEQDQKLEVIMKELEKSLLESKSKLEEEKRSLETANDKLKFLEDKSKDQEEKVRSLETQARQSEIERERAAQVCAEKQVKVGQLSRELDELRSQLEKSLNEKRATEEQSMRNELKRREENEMVRKKLDIEVETSRSKQGEIMALEKAVSELSSKLEATEMERKSLIEKLECSENGAIKGIPVQDDLGKIFWPAAAVASTGTLAAAAFMVYLKYSRER